MQDFDNLLTSIGQVHETLRRAAAVSFNRFLTMRNWLIGMYIVEYEQQGCDRAKYGSGLLDALSQKLKEKQVNGSSVAALRNYRQFYNAYAQLRDYIANETRMALLGTIQQQAAVELLRVNNQSVSALSPRPETLIKHFSFTHFVELMRISDPLKRAFYEIEGIKGCWSVPQLKRQIESLLYERTGNSKDKTAVVAAANKQNVPATIDDLIRDPYILAGTGEPGFEQFAGYLAHVLPGRITLVVVSA